MTQLRRCSVLKCPSRTGSSSRELWQKFEALNMATLQFKRTRRVERQSQCIGCVPTLGSCFTTCPDSYDVDACQPKCLCSEMISCLRSSPGRPAALTATAVSKRLEADGGLNQKGFESLRGILWPFNCSHFLITAPNVPSRRGYMTALAK